MEGPAVSCRESLGERAAVGQFGAVWRPGIRVEVSDHVARTPLGLHISEADAAGVLISDSAVDFGRTHNLSATAGIVVQFGR